MVLLIHESGTFEHLPDTSPSYGKKCYATLICLFLSVKEKLISLKAFFVPPPPNSSLTLSPLQDDGCGFANHELSTVPHPLGDPVSAPCALFPVVLPCFLLPLCVSDLFPLSVSPSHLLSPLFDDWCRFISFCYPRGSRACDARGPRGQRPSQTFRTSCSLNSSWETNEDEFGAWMWFSTKGVLGFSQSVCSSVILRLLRLFLLFGFCSVLFQFTI